VKRLFVIAALSASVVFGLNAGAQEKKGPVYATLKTTMGDIVIQLFDGSLPYPAAGLLVTWW